MPTKEDLEIEKLGLEIRQLRRDLTRMGRLGSLVLPSLVSVATAFGAFASILISVYTLNRQSVVQDEQRKLLAEETDNKLLQEALSMATDGKAQSDRRISGIYQLGPLELADPRRELVVANTLAALVALPDKDGVDASPVRCAAAAAIGLTFEPSATITNGQSQRKHIAQLLYGTAGTGDQSGSLGLITRQNNVLRRKQGWQPVKEDFNDKTIGCETPLVATREAIRRGYAYLASANFKNNDLSYTRLYAADLQGAELTGAQLVGNLRCANLLNANLKDAKINRFDKKTKDDATMI